MWLDGVAFSRLDGLLRGCIFDIYNNGVGHLRCFGGKKILVSGIPTVTQFVIYFRFLVKETNTDETLSPVCWSLGNCPINFLFTHTVHQALRLNWRLGCGPKIVNSSNVTKK